MTISNKKFVKNKENFVCEHCEASVIGNGYTNHCPECLWSKHVDIQPGDRAATCHGLMRPIKVEGPTDNFILVHECTTCGYRKNNKISPQDSSEAVISVVKASIR